MILENPGFKSMNSQELLDDITERVDFLLDVIVSMNCRESGGKENGTNITADSF